MKRSVQSKWVVLSGVMAIIADAQLLTAQQGAGKANNAQTFLTHAAQDGEAEIELGRMAQEKAADAKVKDFGARMQKDHGNANAELRAIAAKKGLTIPGGPGPHAAMMKKLGSLQGAAFDSAYMRAMVDDHAKAVKEFEMATKSPDAEIKAFAEKTLPTLREHLRLAQEIQKGVGSTIRSSKTVDPPAPANAPPRRDATQPAPR